MQKDNKEKRSVTQLGDKLAMKAATSCVKAWNFTTGKTKVELANTLLTSALAVQTLGVGLFFSENPATFIRKTAATAGFLGGLYYYIQKKNKKMVMQEQKALEISAQDISVEMTKASYKIAGPIHLFTGVFFGVRTFNENNTGLGLVFLSQILLTGPSFYIMRTDSPPPQKDILSRGLEKAKELLRTANLNPFPTTSTCLGTRNVNRT